MIIRKYGIELRRVVYSDIELIRNMRNRPDIRARMHAQEFITPDMQESWFRSIDNGVNYFFLIFYQGVSVGLVQGKNVDFGSRACEGGIYLWSKKALSAGVGVKASVCFADATFSIIGLRKVHAKVRTDNRAAYLHNLTLGYVPDPDLGNEWMRLDKEKYLSVAPRLRRICSSGGDLLPTDIRDAEFPDPHSCLYLYKDLPDDVKMTMSEKLSGLL